MEIPAELKYTPEHEWVRSEDGKAVFGITDFAQHQLGDVVYIEVPAEGDVVEAMQPCGVVESVKAASDLYSPVSGTIVEVNERLVDEPELVNNDPYGDGWMAAIEPSDPDSVGGLLDASAYEKLVADSE
jgi:glycine cleavage system H protein